MSNVNKQAKQVLIKIVIENFLIKPSKIWFLYSDQMSNNTFTI